MYGLLSHTDAKAGPLRKSHKSIQNERNVIDSLGIMDSKEHIQPGFEKDGVSRSLLSRIKTRKLRYFDHVMRHNCWEKD